jgi:hypothetical protein
MESPSRDPAPPWFMTEGPVEASGPLRPSRSSWDEREPPSSPRRYDSWWGDQMFFHIFRFAGRQVRSHQCCKEMLTKRETGKRRRPGPCSDRKGAERCAHDDLAGACDDMKGRHDRCRRRPGACDYRLGGRD